MYIERERAVERVVEKQVKEELPRLEALSVIISPQDHIFPYQDPNPDVGGGWGSHMMRGGDQGGFMDWQGSRGGFSVEIPKRGTPFDEFTIDPSLMFK